MMETAAVYYELKVKTYGFHEIRDLSLFKIKIKTGRMADWGMRIAALEDLDIPFNLALIQYVNNNGLYLYLLVGRKWESKIECHFRDFIQEYTSESIKVESPVELVYFHGPHFGDRYGITHYVFNTFAEKKIPIIICACSGAAIYLVLPDKGLEKAKPVLTEAFVIPKSVDKSLRNGKKQQ